MPKLAVLLIALITILLALQIPVEATKMNLTFCCAESNDLYTVLAASGHRCSRFATAGEAIDKAASGSAVLILADGYPDKPTKLDAALFGRAAEKKLRLFVEYPAALPGIEVGAPRRTEWERAVVSSDAFGESLKSGRILAISDCHFVPVQAEKPLIIVGRVAGFDTAVFGLPKESSPILFELPERNLIVATTQLSRFVTARYAPTEAWTRIWEQILAKLDPATPVALKWEPRVRPAYKPTDRLPRDAEAKALEAMAEWYSKSRLLVSTERKAEVEKLLFSGEETHAAPGADVPVGDGSHGILEGYAAAIGADGSQLQRLPLRSDCQAEVAAVLALDASVHSNPRSREIARNLLDYTFFTSGICKGPRGDAKSPAFGLIAWGDIHPAWLVANYGDDDARVMLGTMTVAACLGSDRWNEVMLRALLANLRTTGPQGFRGDRIDIPELERNGWEYYHDTPRTSLAPHFESYLWACYLWGYRQTGYKEFLERTKIAMRMTMDGYPNQWRWGDSVERARMLLPLAWLVRVEDTPEHRGWLTRVAGDLLTVQAPCGALQERMNASGGGGHYFAPQSNEAYGTGETPLIQQNGDPVSDQLYTTGFALLGLHEAVAATGDAKLKAAEDRLADYLCRIQVHSPSEPTLDGCWFRAFDYHRWEYWASSGDAGWGAWSAETGWAQAWTAAVLGLRVKHTSLWQLTEGVELRSRFREVKQAMSGRD